VVQFHYFYWSSLPGFVSFNSRVLNRFS